MISGTPLAHDDSLPKLAEALNASRMKGEFEKHLFSRSVRTQDGNNGRFHVEECRIERVKYKRGQKCLVCYALDISDGKHGNVTRQLVSTRMYPPGRSRSRFEKASQQTLGKPTVGLPLVHIGHLDMVAWAFPNERKLAGLPLLVDPDRLLQQQLPRLVRGHFGPSWTISGVDHAIAHYVPERSCTVRVEMKLEQKKTAAQRYWTVFGKTYYNDDGREVFRHMRQLRGNSAVPSQVLELPQALAYDESSRTLWQEGLCGDPLMKRHPAGNVAGEDAVLLAHAIAEFHTRAIDRLPLRTVSGVLTDAIDKLTIISAAWPACADRCSEVAALLAASVPPECDLGTLHTDLHPNNVFLFAGRIALIDLDGLLRGPVLADLGSWNAGALYRARLHNVPFDECQAELAAFARHYQDYRGIKLEPESLNWFTAAALVSERCSRAVSRLKPGRLQIIDDLAALAVSLARGEKTILRPGYGLRLRTVS